MPDYISALSALEHELDRQVGHLPCGSDSAGAEAVRRKISGAYLKLGKGMDEARRIEHALAAGRKALQLAPADPDAVHFVASKLEKLNRVDEAWRVLQPFEEQCGPLYDRSKKLFLLQARLEQRRGNPETARRMLQRFITENPDHGLQAAANGWLGKLLDELGDHDSAMHAFHECNRRIAATPEGIKWRRKNDGALAEIETSLRWYGNRGAWERNDAGADAARPAPVLLVGYPRSGTTLLDQVLDTHPALTTLSEQPALDGIAQRFFGSEDKLAALEDLGDDELAACRQMYWSNVAQFIGDRPPASRIVDKLPLNIMLLDIYMRLFPDVKIIVALRDPRDVVLSNYMQMYKLNPEMAASLSLADGARYYAKVMELYLLFRRLMPGSIHEIRYEDLVRDFGGESGRLLDFLELEWDDKLLSYHEHAQQRWIGTPSYDQVIRPVYRDAIGRWEKYESHLAEIMPVLQPYVEAFGYAARPTTIDALLSQERPLP